MFYSSSKYDSLLDWVFSLSGIVFILIVVAVIWMAKKYLNNKKSNSKNQNSNNQSSNSQSSNIQSSISPLEYTEEMGAEKSFWDEIKGKDKNPVRDEEPVPPNAIPPSLVYKEYPFEELKIEENCEMVKRSDGLYEKDCTKNVIEDDVIFNDVVEKNIPSNENVTILKNNDKENK